MGKIWEDLRSGEQEPRSREKDQHVMEERLLVSRTGLVSTHLHFWEQELFTWRLLIMACILTAVTSELVFLATKTARKLEAARKTRWPKGRPPEDSGG